jgi:surface polysaccharide O-acyltransferase-like enzyme
MEFGNAENIPVFHICSELFSQILSRVVVPLFFFISGFLFFRNIDAFTKRDYLRKLKSRGKTLLIPYLFWNITTFLIHYTAQYIPALDGMRFRHRAGYDLQDLPEALWGSGDFPHPIVYPFWFIRDLMVIVLLTPVIYFYLKKTGVYGVLLLGALWFFNRWVDFPGSYVLSISVIFFFTAGAWFGSNGRNLMDEMSRVKYTSFILYLLLVAVDLLTKQNAFDPFIHNAEILVGITCWFNLADYLLRTGKAGVNRFLTSSSFFLFAVHEPFLLTPLRKLLYAVLRPQSDLLITALYFLIVFVTVLIALGLYCTLKRFMPAFTAIITGGR